MARAVSFWSRSLRVFKQLRIRSWESSSICCVTNLDCPTRMIEVIINMAYAWDKCRLHKIMVLNYILQRELHLLFADQRLHLNIAGRASSALKQAQPLCRNRHLKLELKGIFFNQHGVGEKEKEDHRLTIEMAHNFWKQKSNLPLNGGLLAAFTASKRAAAVLEYAVSVAYVPSGSTRGFPVLCLGSSSFSASSSPPAASSRRWQHQSKNTQ